MSKSKKQLKKIIRTLAILGSENDILLKELDSTKNLLESFLKQPKCTEDPAANYEVKGTFQNFGDVLNEFPFLLTKECSAAEKDIALHSFLLQTSSVKSARFEQETAQYYVKLLNPIKSEIEFLKNFKNVTCHFEYNQYQE